MNSFRLKGYDSDWQPATRRMRADYRDLPPGDYTFQVRAVDRDLNYSETTQVRLSITSDPRIDALTDVTTVEEARNLSVTARHCVSFKSILEKLHPPI